MSIRPECLRPAADNWERPTGEEVRAVLQLAGITMSDAAKVLGLGEKGDRTVRRWVSEESKVPYAVWAILCDYAGQGLIWRDTK